MWWGFDLNIPKPPPGLSANDRFHHMVKARATADVRATLYWLCARCNVPAMARCRVDVVWVVKDRRRRDTDNLAPLLKAIYDGIGSDKGTSAHIVPDDAPEFMEKPGATIRYDKDATPHFEITITEVFA